jgi:hypothetical protein
MGVSTRLLGLDYFNLTGLGIFPRDRILKYPDGYVYLNDRETDELMFNELLMMDIDEDEAVAPEEYLEWNAENREIRPEIELPENLNTRFVELSRKIERNSARIYMELGGGCRVGEFKVELTEPRVINKYPYRRSEEEKREIEKMCDELYEAK